MKKTAVKKAPVTRKSAPKKPPAKKPAAPSRAAAKKAPAKKAARKAPAANELTAKEAAAKWGQRADYGKPIDAFFAKQQPALRPVLEKLRELVEGEIPEAESSMKWGMPFYSINGVMTAALGGHKAHVNLMMAGPPGTFADPEGILEGHGQTGRRLVVSRVDQIPVKAVKGWLKAAVANAKAGPKKKKK